MAVFGNVGTVADFLAAARVATIAGDHDRARAICVSLYRRLFASEHSLFASEHYYVRFVDVLLREGLVVTAETLMRDFMLTLQHAGQTEAQEALLRDAILRFADNPCASPPNTHYWQPGGGTWRMRLADGKQYGRAGLTAYQKICRLQFMWPASMWTKLPFSAR
jgi:hypothetical protein